MGLETERVQCWNEVCDARWYIIEGKTTSAERRPDAESRGPSSPP